MRGMCTGPLVSDDFFIILDRLVETLDKHMHKWHVQHVKLHKCWKHIFCKKRHQAISDLMIERMMVAYDLAAAFFYLHENRCVLFTTHVIFVCFLVNGINLHGSNAYNHLLNIPSPKQNRLSVRIVCVIGAIFCWVLEVCPLCSFFNNLAFFHPPLPIHNNHCIVYVLPFLSVNSDVKPENIGFDLVRFLFVVVIHYRPATSRDVCDLTRLPSCAVFFL